MKFPLIEDAVFEKLNYECDITHFINQDYLQNPDFGTDLRKYCFIKFYPEKFKESTIELYYNKYYWFLKFKHKFNKTNGEDSGIEQQAFNIIEEGETMPELDWNIMQSIKETVEV